MHMNESCNWDIGDASNRDREPTGQTCDDPRPLAGSRHHPEAHPSRAQWGTAADGSSDDAGGRAPRRHTSAPATSHAETSHTTTSPPQTSQATSSGIVHCFYCRAALRWPEHRSGRVRCPKCHRYLILRCMDDGHWEVFPENDDSISGMICDWLGQRIPDEESDS